MTGSAPGIWPTVTQRSWVRPYDDPQQQKEREDKNCIAVYRSDKGNCIDRDSRWVDVQRVEFPIGLSSPPTVAGHKALMAT